MTTLRDAAQQALEAMEVWRDSLFDENALPGWRFSVLGEKAITDLRAALSEEAMQRLTDVQQEIEASSQESRQVEPVAWMVYTLDGQSVFITDNAADFTQENRALPLYTDPPKREPLTDEEIREIADCGNYVAITFADGAKGIALDKVTVCDLARAIEQAHGIGSEE